MCQVSLVVKYIYEYEDCSVAVMDNYKQTVAVMDHYKQTA